MDRTLKLLPRRLFRRPASPRRTIQHLGRGDASDASKYHAAAPAATVFGCSRGLADSHESAAWAAPATLRERLRARRYEEALRLYQAAEFGEARHLLRDLLAEHPADTPARLLAERIDRFVGAGNQAQLLSKEELASWTGVTNMREK
mmetsp:Transcript_105252/g.328125  ORF Transcript_105252/g.328125 Transcript_105252/m.328125 type:complete len:147 (+) Transcript_105252:62-502(+)